MDGEGMHFKATRPVISKRELPYYRKLTLHEIKVFENDFRIKKINAKREVEFHDKGN